MLCYFYMLFTMLTFFFFLSKKLNNVLSLHEAVGWERDSGAVAIISSSALVISGVLLHSPAFALGRL